MKLKVLFYKSLMDWDLFIKIILCIGNLYQLSNSDLKLSNILINDDGIIKLADFGLSWNFESINRKYT
jgi:serine/threonine protein kinase